jgi:hypothetical protein
VGHPLNVDCGWEVLVFCKMYESDVESKPQSHQKNKQTNKTTAHFRDKIMGSKRSKVFYQRALS